MKLMTKRNRIVNYNGQESSNATKKPILHSVRFIAVVITVTIAVCIYIAMVCHVNATYPQNKKTIASLGQALDFQGAQLSVSGAELLDGDSFVNNEEIANALNLDVSRRNPDNHKLVILNAVVSNPGNTTIMLDLTCCHLESNDFSLQLYFPLMLYYNDCGMYVELTAGEQKSLKLPVPLEPEYFTTSAWPNVKNRDYFLVYSLYPEKKMVEIKITE